MDKKKRSAAAAAAAAAAADAAKAGNAKRSKKDHDKLLPDSDEAAAAAAAERLQVDKYHGQQVLSLGCLDYSYDYKSKTHTLEEQSTLFFTPDDEAWMLRYKGKQKSKATYTVKADDTVHLAISAEHLAEHPHLYTKAIEGSSLWVYPASLLAGTYLGTDLCEGAVFKVETGEDKEPVFIRLEHKAVYLFRDQHCYVPIGITGAPNLLAATEDGYGDKRVVGVNIVGFESKGRVKVSEAQVQHLYEQDGTATPLLSQFLQRARAM